MSHIVEVEGDKVTLRPADGGKGLSLTREEASRLSLQLQSLGGVYTPPPVAGYRKLPQDVVDLMNSIKAVGNDHLAPLLQAIREHIEADNKAHGTPDAESMRCLALGKTNLQQGLMWALRAVAKPEGF